MGIFKAYDIRGIYPAQIDEALAERIGRAAAEHVGARRVVIGRDVRLSAPSIAEAAARGAAQAAEEVRTIGLCTTPMLYFAAADGGFDLGVMVTASHNPPEYIGFKLCREDAIPIGEESGLREIEAAVGQRSLASLSRFFFRIEPLDVAGAYREHLHRFARPGRRLKVAVDAANGTVGVHFDRLLGDLPVDWERLCFEPDGSFPNHEPDPLKEKNTADLRERIVRAGCDFGVAFDGDGDRAVFADERGRVLPGDAVTCLLAREALRRSPGAVVAYDLRSSRVVEEEIRRLGGRPLKVRVGHAFIKAAMRRDGAAFAGELSGHYYFRENHYADSALIAFLWMLNAVSESSRPLSAMMAQFARTAKSPEINFRVEDKAAAMEEAARAFGGGRVERLDGVTVELADGAGWFNLRPSNTEPLLRLNAEAADERGLRDLLVRLESILGKPSS
jgi:phosphomannomutase